MEINVSFFKKDNMASKSYSLNSSSSLKYIVSSKKTGFSLNYCGIKISLSGDYSTNNNLVRVQLHVSKSNDFDVVILNNSDNILSQCMKIKDGSHCILYGNNNLKDRNIRLSINSK